MSLRIKMFLVTAVMIIASVWIFAYLLIARVDQTVFIQTTKLMTEQTEGASQVLDGWFSERSVLLQSLAAAIEYNHLEVGHPDLIPFLENATQKFPKQLHYVYIGFQNKTHITTRPTKPPIGFDPTGRIWFVQATQQQKPVVTEPYADIQTGQIALSIAVPVQLRTPGVLAADLYYADFATLAQQTLFQPLAQTLFISKEGRLIYTTEAAEYNWIGKSLLSVESAKFGSYVQNMLEKRHGSFQFSWHGKEYHAIYAPVASAGWLVVTFIPTDVFRAERQKIIAYAALISLVALVLSFLGALFLIGRITAPLRLISAVAAEVGKGNMKVPFHIRGSDEFRKVADCLEKMRGEILALLSHKDDLIQETLAQEEEIQSLYQQMVAMNAELTKAFAEKNAAYIETIRALADAVEAKDIYTHGHSHRVLVYAVAIGEAMQPNGDHSLLQYAAILHDIGKIGVPSALLNKPTQLTQAEYEIIKRHPEIGYKIIKNIEYLQGVDRTVRQHHEWVNGTGYPDGLTGDEIQFEAKILSVADAYDAMTSLRPYRKALTPQEACAELRRNKGIQFDEAIVDIFCTLVEDNPERYQPHIIEE